MVEGGPSDVVYHADGSPGYAGEVPNITGNDDNGVSEPALNFEI